MAEQLPTHDVSAEAGTPLAVLDRVRERRRRLERYATWTRKDLRQAEEAVIAQRASNDELWR